MASSNPLALALRRSQAKQPLSALIPDIGDVTVTVRVLRRWEVHTPKGGDRPVAVEMVIVDKEGTRIMLHLDMAYIYRHGGQLHEGCVVNISNFIVTLAHGEYRPTRHECRLSLRFHSVIQPMPTAEVDLPPYQFTAPEECFEKNFNRSYLVDVVGVLTGTGTESEFINNGRSSTRLMIHLDNHGYRFSVTLFGEYTKEMTDFRDAGGAPGAVIAVLFCKVSKWPGGISIQTTQRTSKLLFNPDIPENEALRESSQPLTVTPLTITKRSQSNSIEENYLSMEQKFTLLEVRELLEVKEFVAMATINSIVERIPWWYWGCTADGRKCTEEVDAPGLFFCPGCYKHVDNVVRKLFLKLRIHDDTDCLNYLRINLHETPSQCLNSKK